MSFILIGSTGFKHTSETGSWIGKQLIYESESWREDWIVDQWNNSIEKITTLSSSATPNTSQLPSHPVTRTISPYFPSRKSPSTFLTFANIKAQFYLQHFGQIWGAMNQDRGRTLQIVELTCRQGDSKRWYIRSLVSEISRDLDDELVEQVEHWRSLSG